MELFLVGDVVRQILIDTADVDGDGKISLEGRKAVHCIGALLTCFPRFQGDAKPQVCEAICPFIA
jgi:hypothetical protein